MTDVERVEGLLREAIESGLEEGWYLMRGCLRGQDSPCACALGMAVRDVDVFVTAYGPDETPLYAAVKSRLDLSQEQMTSIWMGFDAQYENNEYQKLGARLSRDYFEVEESE